MKKHIFNGVCTALVTPFSSYGVDYKCMNSLIDRQIKDGVNAIVLCGTTGEAPTLKDKEHKKIISQGVIAVNSRLPVIAGAGSNDTSHAIMMAKFCESVGASALLTVTPYYNKTTQNGLIAHFFKIADSVNIPLIIYNVPSRTGINIEIETYYKLIEHPNISGIKESSDGMKNFSELSLITDNVDLYCGNDYSMIPYLTCGASGIISVISNVIPEKVVKIYKLCKSGKTPEAKKLYKQYRKLILLAFKSVNPIPVKYLMSKLKMCDNRLRAPLLPMQDTKELDSEIEKLIAEGML